MGQVLSFDFYVDEQRQHIQKLAMGAPKQTVEA